MTENTGSQSRPPTAAVVVIGDEVLSGRVRDENGHYLAARLVDLGVDIEGMSVLPDRMEVLVDFIAHWSRQCDYVLTSGGIGPTHDDITRQAVAAATGHPIAMHPEAELILRDYYGPSLTPVHLAMAMLPEGAELIRNPLTGVPGCISDNVFVLPGIPSVLRPMFESIAHRFSGIRIFHREISTPAYEEEFADILKRICTRYPSVQVGSYPRLGDPAVRSIITMRSRDAESLESIQREVASMLLEIPR